MTDHVRIIEPKQFETTDITLTIKIKPRAHPEEDQITHTIPKIPETERSGSVDMTETVTSEAGRTAEM